MSVESGRDDLLDQIDRRAAQLRRHRHRWVISITCALVLAVAASLIVVLHRDDTTTRVVTASSAPPTTAPRSAHTAPSTVAPGQPTVCRTKPGKYTQDQLHTLRPDVESMIQGNFASAGTGANSIMVVLLPGREPLAARLIARFHDAVEITVGSTPYCGRPGVSPPCPTLAGSDSLPPGLHLALNLDRSAIAATDMVNGKLTVTNTSPAPFQMDPGQPVVGLLVKPGSRTVIGSYPFGTMGTGLGLRLQTGQSATIRVVVGTARCGGGTGSALPAGTYAVRAGIGPHEGPAQYLAPEAPLVIN